jgi:hypothetical protein
MTKLSTIISTLASRRDALAVASGFADLVRTHRSLFDSYRPELHYMRGPGPKWHAKHDAPSQSMSIQHQLVAST